MCFLFSMYLSLLSLYLVYLTTFISNSLTISIYQPIPIYIYPSIPLSLYPSPISLSLSPFLSISISTYQSISFYQPNWYFQTPGPEEAASSSLHPAAASTHKCTVSWGPKNPHRSHAWCWMSRTSPSGTGTSPAKWLWNCSSLSWCTFGFARQPHNMIHYINSMCDVGKY